MIRQSLLALALPFASTALAEGPVLASPIDCDLDETCYIQQYMDRDRTNAFTDYHCSTLSYNGHRGTDFAVPHLAMMEEGVNVLAAASGRVRGKRDGMPDTGLTAETAALIRGRECGNGLVIEHGDGWSTQYCHLKQGSVQVEKGQQVNVGDVIGQVGQSGRAEFPHVHFSLRKNDVPIDPFDPDGTLSCGQAGDSTQWADPPKYQPGGIIDMGFNTAVPDYADVKAGTAAITSADKLAPAIVVFGFSYGTQTGDILRLVISGPEGEVISRDTKLTRNHAQAFRAIGKKRRRGLAWPVGTYTGTAALLRGDKVVSTRTQEFIVE